MFKNSIIQQIAIKTNLPENEVRDILSVFLEEVKSGVLNGDEVDIPGIGSLRIQHGGNNLETDPESGKSVMNPPKDELVFESIR